MPPDYENLPKPDTFQQSEENNQKDEFQKIISKNDKAATEKNNDNSSLEESIIEKIN